MASRLCAHAVDSKTQGTVCADKPRLHHLRHLRLPRHPRHLPDAMCGKKIPAVAALFSFAPGSERNRTRLCFRVFPRPVCPINGPAPRSPAPRCVCKVLLAVRPQVSLQQAPTAESVLADKTFTGRTWGGLHPSILPSIPPSALIVLVPSFVGETGTRLNGQEDRDKRGRRSSKISRWRVGKPPSNRLDLELATGRFLSRPTPNHHPCCSDRKRAWACR